jgi:hypothetical protein
VATGGRTVNSIQTRVYDFQTRDLNVGSEWLLIPMFGRQLITIKK